MLIKKSNSGMRLAPVRTFGKQLAGSVILLLFSTLSSAIEVTAFPGAVGWAAQTPGGRGGQIIRVSNLESSGPGSLREALETSGPRIVVFEVGGIIDLGQQTLRITEPFITIAGQTAPSPGITIIKGGIDISTHAGRAG